MTVEIPKDTPYPEYSSSKPNTLQKKLLGCFACDAGSEVIVGENAMQCPAKVRFADSLHKIGVCQDDLKERSTSLTEANEAFSQSLPGPRQPMQSAETKIPAGSAIVATHEQQAELIKNIALLTTYCEQLAGQQAPDIVQTASIRFLTSVPPTVQEPEQVRAWLWKTARRFYINSSIRDRRIELAAPESFHDIPDTHEVEASLEIAESAGENARALAVIKRRLPPRQWQLVEELYINERDKTEVAAELDITLDTLHARKVRVWQAIKRMIERQEVQNPKCRKKERIPVTDLLRDLMNAKEWSSHKPMPTRPQSKRH